MVTIMAKRRDEFNGRTKRMLAERVGYRCSFPDCDTYTIGPNTNVADKHVILGEAAHIHAAAPGGPRYLSSMSQAERGSITNGIWLCRHHARIIDANEAHYSGETIKAWKHVAEERAYQELEKRKATQIALVPETLTDPPVVDFVPPMEKFKTLARKINGEKLSEKINAKAQMRLYRELVPLISERVMTLLERELTPLFFEHHRYQSFENNTFEYNTSYDFELHLYKRGIVQQIGLHIKLMGFKQAGVKAFDSFGDLYLFFNDYYYGIGSNRQLPWLTKLYDQMLNNNEIEAIANQFIGEILNRINAQLEKLT